MAAALPGSELIVLPTARFRLSGRTGQRSARTRSRWSPTASSLDPGLASLVERAAGRSAAALLEADATRARLGTAMGRFHSDWDVLLTPTVPIAAFEALEMMFPQAAPTRTGPVGRPSPIRSTSRSSPRSPCRAASPPTACRSDRAA